MNLVDRYGFGLVILRRAHQIRVHHSQDLRRCNLQFRHQHEAHGFDDVYKRRVSRELDITSFRKARCTNWARLSDRENALLQWGQMYGRS